MLMSKPIQAKRYGIRHVSRPSRRERLLWTWRSDKPYLRISAVRSEDWSVDKSEPRRYKMRLYDAGRAACVRLPVSPDCRPQISVAQDVFDVNHSAGSIGPLARNDPRDPLARRVELAVIDRLT